MTLSETLVATIEQMIDEKVNEKLANIQTNNNQQQYFNIGEAAAYMHMGRTKFYQLRKIGEFSAPPIMRNEQQFYKRADLDKYMAEQKVKEMI